MNTTLIAAHYESNIMTGVSVAYFRQQSPFALISSMGALGAWAVRVNVICRVVALLRAAQILLKQSCNKKLQEM